MISVGVSIRLQLSQQVALLAVNPTATLTCAASVRVQEGSKKWQGTQDMDPNSGPKS